MGVIFVPRLREEGEGVGVAGVARSRGGRGQET